MEKKTCQSCFQEYEGSACPHCGGAQNDEHQLPVGTILRERYQVGKVLGQGGFGITYLGWDRLFRRTVAVKEFYPSGKVFRLSATSTAVECSTSEMIPHYEYSKERFLREAGALVDFKDIPEVVDILDFIEENNTAYIVMEYVRGVDLAKYTQRKGGKLSVEETFRILGPVMEALSKVHKGGIVHRDISPDNIILDPLGGAKLLDFGAVRVVEDPDVEKGLNKSTEAIIKHGFAPIEQYNSRGSLGPWTDEYAMCATIWYCLTGTVPEEASVRMTEEVDPDWSTVPGLPEHQQKALAKGISRRASDRYESMDGLLADLFPSGEAGAAQKSADRETGPSPSAPKKGKKLLWLLAPVAAAVILAAVFLPGLKAEPAPETAPQELQTQPSETQTTPTEAPLDPREQDYLVAEQLLEEGKFLRAIERFTQLGDYKDSADRIPECHYKWAESYLAEGSFQEAIDKFTELGDYSDSADRVPECHYKWAESLLAAGSFQEAIDRFTALGNYQDSSLKVMQCHYQWADALLAAGSFQEAIDKFTQLGIYQDSAQRALQCSYLWGEALLEEGKLGEAAIRFGRVTGYSDARDRSFGLWAQIAQRDTVSAGSDHSVALRADGTVVAVGTKSATKCDVSSWTDIIAISAGEVQTVGLRSDGTVVAKGSTYASGSNYKGSACDVGSWTDIVAIDAGSHTVGLRADGTVVATGDNYYGQCNVEEWSDIVAVCAGSTSTLGLKADGTVVAAGSLSDDVADWTDIVMIDASYYTAVGVRSDGTVVIAGSTSYDRYTVFQWTDIVAITVGEEHIIGIRSDGTIVTVGNKELGRSNVTYWTDIVAISAGEKHTIGLRSDGTVVSTGDSSGNRCNVWNWTDILIRERPIPFR